MTDSGRTIGRLAEEAGVNVETIRYYERRGILKQPPTKSSGWRRYDDMALLTIRFVRRAQQLGFSLDEIAVLLKLKSSQSERTCGRVRAKANEKIADIDARIRDLQAMRAALEELAEACPADGSANDCPILGVMSRGEVDA